MIHPDESDNPTLLEAVEAVVDAALEQVYTSLPAKVTRYDENRQAVDAQPVVRPPVRLPDGTIVHPRLPVVQNAPYMFPVAGPYGHTWPVPVGSHVMLHFPSGAIDRWFLNGVEIDTAGDAARHSLNAAFAAPGPHSFGGPARPQMKAPQDALVMHAPGSTEIRLGSPIVEDNAVGESVLLVLLQAIMESPDGIPFSSNLKLKLATELNWPQCQTKVKLPR